MNSESKFVQRFFNLSFMTLLTGRTTSKSSRSASESDKAGFSTQTIGGGKIIRFGLSTPASARGFAKVRDSSEASQDNFSLRTASGPQDLELGEVKTTKTFIHSAGEIPNTNAMSREGNGIRLQQDVYQSWKMKK
jgi:hypothetical protein